MEAKAELPTQLQMSMAATLAKNDKVERPITLTSVLYRTWRKLRKGLMDEWQTNLPAKMDYDRAGATALHVALERLMRQESNKTLDVHGITVLLDMSTLYDTIDLARLQETAMNLQYPPLALEFATQEFSLKLSSASGSTPQHDSQQVAHKHPCLPKLSCSRSLPHSKPTTQT